MLRYCVSKSLVKSHALLILRALLKLLLLLNIPLLSFAQMHQWVRTNPGGGGAFSTIGAGPTGTVIAGSDLSGAYRSVDGGQTWDVIGASRGLTETHVSGIGFHRFDGNLLYIGTENGLFRSDNGGDTVVKVLATGYITDIAFATDQPNIGYAAHHPSWDALNAEVYKSTDNGLTWTQVSTSLPDDLHILKIEIDPTDADIVYILTGKGRFVCGPAEVYKSTDGGTTWVNLTAQLPEILDFALDPSNPQVVYVTTMNADCDAPWYWTDLEGYLYKSTDGGNTWGTPLYDLTGVIFIDPTNPAVLRLIDPREPYPWNPTAGTWTSTDGGQTFVKTGDVNDWDTFFTDYVFIYGVSYNDICKTLGKDLSNPNTIYWVNTQWAFKSADNGSVFQNIFTHEVSPGWWRSRGLDNVDMLDIAINESHPDTLFITYFDLGIWQSFDGGESWQSCNDEVFTGSWNGQGGNAHTILSDPQRPQVVWASQSENQDGEYPTYLIKSTQTGDRNSWVASYSGLPLQEIIGLSLDRTSPVDHRTLYVTAEGDVYKSMDDGTTWSMVFDCDGCRFTAVDPFEGQVVYAGGEDGLWRSTDGGNTWTDVSHPEMKASPGSDYWDYGSYDGVFDIQPDPDRPGRVYVTALGENKGLYRSDDYGETWTKILTDDYLRKVAVVPGHNHVLYATSSSAISEGGYDPASNGIWFSTDSGQTWTRQNQGMTWPFALTVAVSAEPVPTVFVGSPGTGFQKSPVPLEVLEDSDPACPGHLRLFPNPTTGTLFLDSRIPYRRIRVFNLSGSLVATWHGFSGSRVLDLSSLSPGVYFLQLEGGRMPWKRVFKIVKQ